MSLSIGIGDRVKVIDQEITGTIVEIYNNLIVISDDETLQYDYVVEAKNEDEAHDLAKEELRWAIGYDASKDWQCSNIEEEA